MEAIDAIREILAENLDIAPESVTEESEDKLDIDFGEPEGLLNVGDVVRYLESL